MNALAQRLGAPLNALAPIVLPTLARFVFAAVLFFYYFNAGRQKIGDGLFSLDPGAYIQIFPKAFEAAGYDPSAMSGFHQLVALAGTWAELVLPVLVVIGLLTRLSALGLIGVIVVQSLTDIWGHGADATTIGAWFDGSSASLILDQRAFWVLGLLILVFRGAGPLSLDRLIFGRTGTV